MARRTFAEYKAAVTHALGAAPATGVTTADIVNDALYHLISIRDWNWLRGASTTLSLTAAQAFVNLPTDFGEEESLTYPGTSARQMFRTTIDAVQEMRSAGGSAGGFAYYYAVNSGTSATLPQDGLGVSRLELYPTPSATATNVLVLVYRRHVRRLSSDTDTPQIPEWMDQGLFFLVRAFAMAVEDDLYESAPMKMFERLLPDLERRDASTQRRMGVMRGGLYPTGSYANPFYPSSIGDPS